MMSSHRRFYAYAAGLMVFAGYQIFKQDWMEASLYLCAAVAFGVNGLTSEPRLSAYKRPMVIISWILIIATAILFLYLLQFKFA
jgi:uncharacterized membrane protein YoaK (UPF0700 family)